MKLIPLAFSSPEFFNLQTAVDAVEAALSAAIEWNDNLGKAKKRLFKGNFQQPQDSAKWPEWHRKKYRGLVDVAFYTHGLERAMDDLRHANFTLNVSVEAARKFLLSVELMADRSYGDATVNVLKADDLRSGVAARLEQLGNEIYVSEEGALTALPDDMSYMRGLLEGTARNFTVRYRLRDGSNDQWHYIQREHADEDSTTPPSAPCLTRRQAEVMATRLLHEISESNPGYHVDADIYDIEKALKVERRGRAVDHPDSNMLVWVRRDDD